MRVGLWSRLRLCTRVGDLVRFGFWVWVSVGIFVVVAVAVALLAVVGE